MKKSQLNDWMSRFEKIKKEMTKIGFFKKGSITRRWQTCGNPNCKCSKDKELRHGPYYWWTFKENARTKAILVPEKMLPEVKSYIENSKLLQNKIKLLEKLSEKIIKMKIKIYRKKFKKS